ncbi:nitrate reductase [Allosediminivita pacifica]|uniref:Assimilatory nitrate reductase (NADH) alpha subunit apoprotein n=1 Tax=Allosediminivita pacifica TaxID=1267769 RepID=A0A2T6B128_9RHOB|nr:nitrate reductase [Allosediminivita pacifica]PTX49784.1 assimilatory nitrate reductase (NADH) alpha subunit apoprotein [Allosediminivita pacifica]GGB04578.1 nitrate reductase [Allosediminivita pacifica]
MTEIRSTCPYCGVGCGVLLKRDTAGGLEIRGDPDHPANRGRLCSKGSALGETLGLEGRLLSPQVNGIESGWDETLQLVADRFKQTVADHGPDSVAFYVSGQMLTEDYYVANKLMKGFIGSANIDTNSRLCMASTVAGHRRAFGTDTVPGTYDDLDEADLVVLVGSNLAWCHPVLFQRVLTARKARGTKLVVIDPRRTASCDGADLHLPLAIGSDVALFNVLLTEIRRAAADNPDALARVEGSAETFAAAAATDPSVTGLDEAQLRAFCKLWIGHEKVVTIFSQGVNQSSAGTDKVNAILNCHIATGRIGKPGMGPFSVTGQPNAMGGREVGGLANMLACHMALENPAHRSAVRTFWNAPQIPDRPGLKAVDMFRAVDEGRIKALWIMHSNPAVTLPQADAVREAIAACPFTVVSDITGNTDTARLAHVLLPASAWGEKSGTVTNSDRTISRQRAALPAPGKARPDWWQMADVGRRMGWSGEFDYTGPAEIFREHAALSGIAGGFGLDFDISALAAISDAEYDTLRPTRWPVAAKRGGRFFADGKSFHEDGRLRMIALTPRGPAAAPSASYPFRLNTGRIRDQWHTMTRTGRSPRLSAHLAEPFAEIHPSDAARLGIAADTLVRLTSPSGRAILRAQITDAVQPETVFAPMHWTGETAPSGRIDALVASAIDPVSGQPESKAALCDLQPYAAAWYGFAVSSAPMAPDTAYWALARTTGGWRAELADDALPSNWEDFARALFGLPKVTLQMVQDPARGAARLAFRQEGRLVAALFAGPRPLALARDHLVTLPGTEAEHVLAGQVPADMPDPGPTLCSCFGIGVNSILRAIEDEGLMSVEEVGKALSAGTNCGSCRPEIAALLERATPKEAAE